jgi:hypothetical protein
MKLIGLMVADFFMDFWNSITCVLFSMERFIIAELNQCISA